MSDKKDGSKKNKSGNRQRRGNQRDQDEESSGPEDANQLPRQGGHRSGRRGHGAPGRGHGAPGRGHGAPGRGHGAARRGHSAAGRSHSSASSGQSSAWRGHSKVSREARAARYMSNESGPQTREFAGSSDASGENNRNNNVAAAGNPSQNRRIFQPNAAEADAGLPGIPVTDSQSGNSLPFRIERSNSESESSVTVWIRNQNVIDYTVDSMYSDSANSDGSNQTFASRENRETLETVGTGLGESRETLGGESATESSVTSTTDEASGSKEQSADNNASSSRESSLQDVHGWRKSRRDSSSSGSTITGKRKASHEDLDPACLGSLSPQSNTSRSTSVESIRNSPWSPPSQELSSRRQCVARRTLSSDRSDHSQQSSGPSPRSTQKRKLSQSLADAELTSKIDNLDLYGNSSDRYAYEHPSTTEESSGGRYRRASESNPGRPSGDNSAQESSDYHAIGGTYSSLGVHGLGLAASSWSQGAQSYQGAPLDSHFTQGHTHQSNLQPSVANPSRDSLSLPSEPLDFSPNRQHAHAGSAAGFHYPQDLSARRRHFSDGIQNVRAHLQPLSRQEIHPLAWVGMQLFMELLHSPAQGVQGQVMHPPAQGVQGQVMHPPAQGVQGQGIQPPAQGVQEQVMHPPAHGVQPQGLGAHPPAQGVQPQGIGVYPPAQGAQPQGQGAQPLVEGLHLLAEAAQIVTQGRRSAVQGGCPPVPDLPPEAHQSSRRSGEALPDAPSVNTPPPFQPRRRSRSHCPSQSQSDQGSKK